MKKLYFTAVLLFIASLSGFATNYTSTGGDWNTATTWTPNGIPTSTDNVTILSGNVTMTVFSGAANITINSGAELSNNNPANSSTKFLEAYGTFTNNGTYSGTGLLILDYAGIAIAGSGAYSSTGDCYFNKSPATITGTMIFSNSGSIYLDNHTTSIPFVVTNQGHVFLSNGRIGLSSGTSNITWTNDTNSYAGFKEYGFISSAGFTINTSAPNDTVDYENAAYNISNTSSNTYYTLIIGGSTKTAQSNLNITNLIINSAGTLKVNGYNLGISGNWVNNGTITTNTGTVTFDGSSAQTITGSGTNPFTNLTLSNSAGLTTASVCKISGTLTLSSGNFDDTGTLTFNGTSAQSTTGSGSGTFANLTLSNSTGLTIGSTCSLSGLLSITAGSLNAGSSLLTLLSNATATARIASVPSASTLSGSFIIQRYITGTTTDYQCLSTPINDMTLSTWDTDAGFYMSGVGGVHGNAAKFKSVYTTNEPLNTYSAVMTTSYVLAPASGVYLYFGDGNTPTDSMEFASTGTPNYGNVSISITKTSGEGNGFNLIGNPYPSPILWTSFHTDNSSHITSSFQIYDEKTGSWVSSNGTTVSNPSSKLDANPNLITMCQGFVCTPSTTGLTILTFKETEKTSSDIPIVQNTKPKDWIRMQLKNNVNSFSDGTILQFARDDSSNADNDVPFRKGFNPMAPELYTIGSDNKKFIVNQLSDTSNETAVSLIAKGGVSGIYTISFEGIKDLQKYNNVTLEDLTNRKTISLRNSNSYTFQIVNPSQLQKFLIHFKHSSANQLAQK